nr:hypothetical protein [uncultured Noviherbaspirillum sp.]
MPQEKSVREQIEDYKANRAAKIAITKIEIEAMGFSQSQLIAKLAEMDFVNKELRIRIDEMKKRRSETDSIIPIVMQIKKEGVTLNGYLRKDAKKSAETGKIISTLLFEPEEIERYEATKRAQKGGAARAALFNNLEKETIRFYLEREWNSAPEAALEITPLIVQMSRNGNGDLAPTTTKPLAWIRAYNRTKK